MRVRETIVTSLALAVLSACSSMPSMPFASSGLHDTSRTGKVHDINIMGDEVTPKRITVKTGDEIRWVNHRTGSVQIAFTNPLTNEALACERNFGTNYETRIGANEAASVCFSRPGMKNYTVRMQANVPGNEIISSGTIEVAGSPMDSQQGNDKGGQTSQRGDQTSQRNSNPEVSQR